MLEIGVVACEVRRSYSRLRTALLAKPEECAPRMLNVATIAESVARLRGMVDEWMAELQLAGTAARGGAGADV